MFSYILKRNKLLDWENYICAVQVYQTNYQQKIACS